MWSSSGSFSFLIDFFSSLTSVLFKILTPKTRPTSCPRIEQLIKISSMMSFPTFGHVHSDFCERGMTLSHELARPRTLDLSSLDHNAPSTSAQVHKSRDRALVMVRGIFRGAEARHWKLCTQPRLSERPSRVFSTLMNLAVSFLTPMMARMKMKIGKTIWTR